jgi:hypothetical protein
MTPIMFLDVVDREGNMLGNTASSLTNRFGRIPRTS